MPTNDKLKKKLHNALKLSGFNVRREFCNIIVDKLQEMGLELNDNTQFDETVKDLCGSLENQNLSEKSIEHEHIQRAIEICLHSGYDQHETIFNVMSAYEFPRLSYDLDRKIFTINLKKSKLLSDANTKASLFSDRYSTILQRTRRNFQKRKKGEVQFKLHTVDYLLTLSKVKLEHTLILGSLLQVAEGKYFLEDPTGIVELDVRHTKYHNGFFIENSFVLVNGLYDDKVLHVSTMALPPGEEYTNSRQTFGNINYFGGLSNVPLRDSQRLRSHLIKDPKNEILIFSDIWLDSPVIFEKLESVFAGIQNYPPIAFVFMGNFMFETYGSRMMDSLRKLFKSLGELICKYTNIQNNSEFVFVPGLNDPCTPHIAPRLPLPSYVTEDIKRILPKAIFTTNPCRLQYCTREIAIFRADLLPKLLQGTLHKPPKETFPDAVARTIISQGHLSPLPLNALPVHWDFDHCLRLYPLPDLVVIGDKCDKFQEKYKECTVINPGSFCESFTFMSYTPQNNEVDECELN